MIIASASFAANDINTKIAVEFLPVTEIIVIRGVTASIFAFSMACFVHGVSQLKTIANRNLFWRSLFEASVGPILITCYAFLPLATVTAVMQFGPFIGMIAGIYLFKETVGWRRWCAAAVAFLGVLLIIKPGSEAFQPIVIPVLFAATLGVARDIQSRKIGNTVPPFVVPLATSLMSILIASALTPIFLPLGFNAWRPWLWPDLYSFAISSLAGIFLVLANMFAFLAFRSGNMSAVSPFRYFYLFFAVIGGMIVFAEFPDYLAFLGMTLIVAGGIYLLHRERLRAKHAAVAAIPPGAQ
jgi:drug/metabolite transporter (DMT)-like permease